MESTRKGSALSKDNSQSGLRMFCNGETEAQRLRLTCQDHRPGLTDPFDHILMVISSGHPGLWGRGQSLPRPVPGLGVQPTPLCLPLSPQQLSPCSGGSWDHGSGLSFVAWPSCAMEVGKELR